MTQPEFAYAIGVSARTISSLETAGADRYDANTLALIEDALGWQPGSAERVLSGARPRLEQDPDLARLRASWSKLSPEARSIVASLVETMAKPRR